MSAVRCHNYGHGHEPCIVMHIILAVTLNSASVALHTALYKSEYYYYYYYYYY